LYERQTDHFDDLLKYGVNIPFGATYNQLAERWGWDRKTVMSYLKALQKMGVLEVKRASYNIEIRILNLACLPQETSLEALDNPP
jgi:DNA-binding IclR family transcriptional regulator